MTSLFIVSFHPVLLTNKHVNSIWFKFAMLFTNNVAISAEQAFIWYYALPVSK